MSILSEQQITKILKLEMQSIRDRQEYGFLICNKDIVPIQNTEWHNGKLDMRITLPEIEKACKKTPFYVGHTHMLYTAKPSKEDFTEYKQSGIPAQGFCTAGVDQVMCFNRNDHTVLTHNWRNQFLPAFQSQNQGLHFEGKNLYCDKMHNAFYCELNDMKGQIQPIGIFQNIMTQGGTQTLNHGSSDFALYSHLPNEKISCFAQNGNQDLMCQVENK